MIFILEEDAHFKAGRCAFEMGSYMEVVVAVSG